jgi:hypothetical protein
VYENTTATTNVGSCNCTNFFTNFVTGLTSGATYHFRAMAWGSRYAQGTDQSFTTPRQPTVTINTGHGYWDAASSIISYSASGGSTGAVNSFILLQSADPATPLSGWVRVATNVGAPGSFPILPVGTVAPKFYRIKRE